MTSLSHELAHIRRELDDHRRGTADGLPWTETRTREIYGIAERLLNAVELYERESRFEGRIGDLLRTFVAQVLRGGPTGDEPG